MEYRNKFDRDGSSQTMGNEAEIRFIDYLKSKNVIFREATLQEQYSHVDFIISTKNTYGVDVKATKRISRHDQSISPEIIWVEFQNEEGYPGWLYGKSKYIVFDKIDEYGFYWIPLIQLRKFCEDNCNKGFTTDVHNAIYKKYQKKGRKDIISQIYFSDLKKLQYVFTPYDNDTIIKLKREGF